MTESRVFSLWGAIRNRGVEVGDWGTVPRWHPHPGLWQRPCVQHLEPVSGEPGPAVSPDLLHRLWPRAPGLTDLRAQHEALCVSLSRPTLSLGSRHLLTSAQTVPAARDGARYPRRVTAAPPITASAKERGGGAAGELAARGRSPCPGARPPRLSPRVPPGLALAFHDGSVHIVHRLSLQTMAVFYGSTAPRSADEPAVKRPRATGPAVHFKAMQLSWTSLALVGIDSHGKVGSVWDASRLPARWTGAARTRRQACLPPRVWRSPHFRSGFHAPAWGAVQCSSTGPSSREELRVPGNKGTAPTGVCVLRGACRGVWSSLGVLQASRGLSAVSGGPTRVAPCARSSWPPADAPRAGLCLPSWWWDSGGAGRGQAGP